jgi:hypothetical protein
MISSTQFQTLSLDKQKEYLLSLIGDIQTESNQELLVCQRLLAVIPNPSSQTLHYIFDSIEGQLQEFHEQEHAEHSHHIKTLLTHISQQEEADKADVDAILSDIELDI